MNNHRRKGHRCAEVVHYGSGIIAFLTLAPIVMKSWQCPTLNDRLRHGSITQVWVPGLVEGAGVVEVVVEEEGERGEGGGGRSVGFC